MHAKFRCLPVFLAAAALSTACETTATGSSGAQQLVEQVAANHPDVARLTLHARPAGSTQLMAVASTSSAKRNRPSDPEDVQALERGEEVVLQEGDHVDVTLPMTDVDGSRSWVAGVTLRPEGRSREEVVARARAIAAELDEAVRAATRPLW
ncbi:MAG TPA: hypothetical protein VK081_03240 [Planctomycetota bacterium]|nr:hypothetical protein [Planctomycetota bacterium]